MSLDMMNWDAIYIDREIRFLEDKIKRLENMPLTEWAIISSNREMFKNYMGEALLLKKQIKDLEAKLLASREKHNKEKEEYIRKLQEDRKKQLNTLSPEEREELAQKQYGTDFEPTPLEDFDFADDMASLASLANHLDKQGFIEAADEIDDLIVKTASKRKKLGKTYVQWIRQLKKEKAPKKIVEKFSKAYQEALKTAKKKFKNEVKIEEFAVLSALKVLPKEYKE